MLSEQRRKERQRRDPEYDALRHQQMRLASKKNRLRTRYGLTLEEFDARLLAQGGGCAICGIKKNQLARDFHVDHNHETGQVRGLLCFACNTGIGKLGDDPDLLEAAAAYLRLHSGA